ncbi:MAG: hypothetical protein RL660_779 [Bacteroidota bacterium]|jgi:hypothetical protein
MKRIRNHYTLLIICVLFASSVSAQSWQQRCDYEIAVNLNDTSSTLSGDCNITYYNNSNDTLRYIFVHAYPNAYRTDKSAFAKQAVENGKTDHYYSKAKDRSAMRDLNFTVNGSVALHSEYNGNPDIYIVDLPEALLPHTSIAISTPFTVYIGKEFSRMGRVGKGFHLTQWYPKLAVYDKDGWHPLPYLDQGEFYADFGKYNVKITVPNNYVVAATGVCTTPSEQTFIDKRIALEKRIASGDSSALQEIVQPLTGTKTVEFVQDSVIDFAWFADRRFVVQKASTTIGGQTKYGYIYYLPENKRLWVNGAKVITHTLEYYSQRVGNYPYVSATAVDGGMHASNGMEYPMITYISGSRDTFDNYATIIHEVGHNWFQGILASNERAHAFLDEGCNTFYDQRCEAAYYGDKHTRSIYDVRSSGLHSIRYNNAQPINTSSELLTENNYYGNVYNAWGNILGQLEMHLGKSTYDSCMQAYYSLYKFKHPQPADMQQVFETISKQKLGWAFEDGINKRETSDFKIKHVKKVDGGYSIAVEHKGTTALPVSLLTRQRDGTRDTMILKPFLGKQEITIANNELIYAMLDPHYYTVDGMRVNNLWRSKALKNSPRFKLKRGYGKTMLQTKELYWLPTAQYNFYDGLGLGFVVHNLNFYEPRLKFYLAPNFGLNSKTLNGAAALTYSIAPKHPQIKTIDFAVHGITFNYNGSSQNISKQIFARVSRVNTSATITWRKRNEYRKDIGSAVKLEHIFIDKHDFGYNRLTDTTYAVFREPARWQQYLQATFTHYHRTVFNPYSYNVQAQAGESFAKLRATFNFKLDYYKPNKALYGRIFAGKYLPYNTNAIYNTSYALAGTTTADNDYTFSHYFIGRSEFDNLLTRQILNEEGGMKINTYKLAKPVGSANDLLLAINLRSDIPIKLPVQIRPFVDACYITNRYPNLPVQGEALYDAGLQLAVLKEIITFNVPLVYSKAYASYINSTAPKGQRLLSTITVNVNTKGFDIFSAPDKLAQFGL